MSIEENKAVVQGDANALDGLLVEGFINHTPWVPPDCEGYKQMLPMYRAAFPDLEISLENIVAEGDRVAIQRNVARRPPGRADGYGPDEQPDNGDGDAHLPHRGRQEDRGTLGRVRPVGPDAADRRCSAAGRSASTKGVRRA